MKTLTFGKDYTHSMLNSTIDARTVPTTSETPSYLVDKRLIDILLAEVITVSLDTIKETVVNIITTSSSVEEMSTKLDDFFYMHKLVTMLKPEEPKAPVTNEFRDRSIVNKDYAPAANSEPLVDLKKERERQQLNANAIDNRSHANNSSAMLIDRKRQREFDEQNINNQSTDKFGDLVQVVSKVIDDAEKIGETLGE